MDQLAARLGQNPVHRHAPVWRCAGSYPAPIALELVAATGTIYYTTDGSDPRAPGGGIAEGGNTSIRSNSPTRRRSPRAPWSAAQSTSLTGTFIIGTAALGDLVVSEITHHPADPSAAEIDAGFADPELFRIL
ncbi:MAG: chitobiase/beta-hexosaminidase C-terminal domain-containing protein [Verrucomicrobiales bacterium]